jgi:uncharacterized protein with FMN-binding domain
MLSISEKNTGSRGYYHGSLIATGGSMTKLLWGISALLLVVFLSACPVEDPDTTNGTNDGKVATPVIGMNPSRFFHNDRIEISFSSSTSGAEFYYTLNGNAPSASSGTKYTGPFFLELDNANIRGTPLTGYIQVQVIGIKEGFRNSTVGKKNLQIFPKETIKDNDGNVIALASDTGIGVGGYHNPTTQKILVTVTVTNGIITADYTNGHEGTDSHTPEYWTVAVNHANLFLSTMNSCDFDTMTGATFSSRAIKDGLKKALAKILE